MSSRPSGKRQYLSKRRPRLQPHTHPPARPTPSLSGHQPYSRSHLPLLPLSRAEPTRLHSYRPQASTTSDPTPPGATMHSPPQSRMKSPKDTNEHSPRVMSEYLDSSSDATIVAGGGLHTPTRHRPARSIAQFPTAILDCRNSLLLALDPDPLMSSTPKSQ
jgi:hypothetical protein